MPSSALLHGQPLTFQDNDVLSHPVSAIVSAVQTASLDPSDVLTNCLTEIMIELAQAWARDAPRSGPLTGVPVSLKDVLAVCGYDSCMGYSARTGQPMSYDGELVRLLRRTGAVPFVKTNFPIMMLSFGSANDVFGTTENPAQEGVWAGWIVVGRECTARAERF
jgi:Asp-tRNA(Asn)/Glu-tRNA(Gln) amidotransferase A subunit family amidase